MFNIWCKVKKINIFLVVFGLIFSVGSIFIDEKYDYKSLILTILSVKMIVLQKMMLFANYMMF